MGARAGWDQVGDADVARGGADRTADRAAHGAARGLRRMAVAAVVVALALAATGCGDDDGGEGATPTTPTAPDTTSAPSTTQPAPDVAEARVYFVRDEAVAAAGRTLDTLDPTNAVEALIAGPDELEADLGMSSAIPEGTELLDVTVEDGTAVVDLSGRFASGGGSLSMEARVAQVVFTLTDLDGIEQVTIHLDGAAVEGIGGEGVDADQLTRADFANVTPAILVEAPTPGQAVASPLVVEGLAEVFEGNVEWVLTDPDGLILDEGFTTAGAAEVGRWAPFRFSVDFAVDRDGSGAVIVFWTSPEDGTQRDLVEVPVRMQAG